MTEPVEKSKLISISYEESPASYHSEELGMSIAPEEALAVSEAPQATAETLDRYQGSLTGLSLDTLIATHVAVRQDEVPAAIQLRSLIVEAGRGTPWAVEELENFLTQALGLKDSSELNICFDSCEANVGDILVQLRQGDEVQRQEAAKSLLGIILGEPRDAGENLADLKRGLLVAAGQISRATGQDTFYREVARLDGKQQQSLWTMSHDSRLQPDPKLLLTLKENLSRNPETKPSTQEEPSEGLAPAPILAGDAQPVPTEGNAPAATTASTKAMTWQGGGLPLIEQILLENLPRAPEQERFLQGAGAPSLGERLASIAQNPQLTPSQISQGLYYAILGRGLSHPDFTSATKHYGELRPVAAQIAGTIIARLGLSSEANAYLKGDYSALRLGGAGNQGNVVGSSETFAVNDASSGTSRLPLIPATRSLGIFADPEGRSAQFANGALAASSAVAAGMMAIPFLSLVARAQVNQTGARQDSRPSYFVDGTTTAQGESHGGSGGQSSQGQQQDRRQSNPDQVVVA